MRQLSQSFRFELWGCRVPEQVRLQHGISPDCDYRLALTAWANGRFEVIPGFTPAEPPLQMYPPNTPAQKPDA